MRAPIALVLLVLCGCAHDDYRVVDQSLGSDAAMLTDLRACKRASIDRYFSDYREGGAIIGGALLGPLGAVVGGAIDNSERPSPSIMNRFTEECMRAKGYEGTSKG